MRGTVAGSGAVARGGAAWHRRPWNSVGDDAPQLLVARHVAKPPGSQIDAAHLIARQTVALGALQPVHDRAGLNVLLAMLAGVLCGGLVLRGAEGD